jgi:hypothetical protein
MSADEPPEELSPAERRLEQHLALLRDTPEAPASMTVQVLHSARWQHAIRAPLLSVAHLTAAAIDTVLLLAGSRQ